MKLTENYSEFTVKYTVDEGRKTSKEISKRTLGKVSKVIYRDEDSEGVITKRIGVWG